MPAAVDKKGDRKPSKLANWIAAFKKFCTVLVVFAVLASIPLMLWKISGGIYGGVSTLEGVIDGVLFVVALWTGFMLGSFFKREPPKSGRSSSSQNDDF